MQIVEKYGKSKDGSRFLQIDDITLHYRDQGQGPALVALHGMCDSLHTWDGWYTVLKNDFRFIRLDLVKTLHSITMIPLRVPSPYIRYHQSPLSAKENIKPPKPPELMRNAGEGCLDILEMLLL